MTTTSIEAATAPVSRPGFFAGLRRSITESLAHARAYRTTYNELYALSDRELNDIGISRSQIRDIATEHAMDVTGRL